MRLHFAKIHYQQACSNVVWIGPAFVAIERGSTSCYVAGFGAVSIGVQRLSDSKCESMCVKLTLN